VMKRHGSNVARDRAHFRDGRTAGWTRAWEFVREVLPDAAVG